jgi:hypothetical protein
MYGWITPQNSYIEVDPCQHSNIGSHDEDAKAILDKHLEDHEHSVYLCLYNFGYIRVASGASKAMFNGNSKHLRDRMEKLKTLANRHDLIAEFDFDG